MQQASVYVAPLRMGSGTRLKLLEAMAFGKAIVSTRIGAEGLVGTDKASNQRELIVVADNDPAAFAAAAVTLLRHPGQRVRLGTAARTFVENHYDWRVIIPRLESLYTGRDAGRRRPVQKNRA
jgi:glycosyltransferase involved in cell wall biosynthesis